MPEMNIYWGETHDNVCQRAEAPVTVEENVRSGRPHLDFYAPAYYTAETSLVEALDGSGRSIHLESWKSPEKLAREWAEVEDATRALNEPGRFVTFPGYEWQGDGSSGDHNVVFRGEGHGIARVNTLPELYAALQGIDAIAIPHHTAYVTGNRGKDWSVHDDRLTPFMEVFSVHGSSEVDDEWIGLRINSKMGPGLAGGTYQDALDRGYHVGAICSTDNIGVYPGPYGWGLMACIASELTRDCLWEAFGQRRVYGVTGDRIELDFRVNGAPMGSCIEADSAREIEVSVRGLDALDRVEVLRNGRVVHTHAHQGTWDLPPAGTRSRFTLRIEAGWGPSAAESGVPGPRHWRGTLTLPTDARLLGASPCWLKSGQEQAKLAGNSASFDLLAPQGTPGQGALHQFATANVFELEACPEDPLTLEMDGLVLRATVAELCGGSRVLADEETADALVRDQYGLAPETLDRPGIARLLAHKVKVHRAIPEAGYSTSVRFVDDEPLGGEANYRVRVEQRNGQRAWSSPVWVSRKP